MSEDKTTNDTLNENTENTEEKAQTHIQELKDTVSALFEAQEKVAEEFKLQVSKILHEHLNIPLNEEGIIDLSDLAPEKIQQATADVIFPLLDKVKEMLSNFKPEEEKEEGKEEEAEIIDFPKPKEEKAVEISPVVLKLGETVKKSFHHYVEEHLREDGKPVRQVEITPQFLKEHGKPLIANIFKAVASQLVPDSVEFSHVFKKEHSEERKMEEEVSEKDLTEVEENSTPSDEVSIKFDLGSFFSSLISKKTSEKTEEVNEKSAESSEPPQNPPTTPTEDE